MAITTKILLCVVICTLLLAGCGQLDQAVQEKFAYKNAESLLVETKKS